MARRQRLSDTQLAELFDPPTEQRELIRHYTLSETDLAAVARCRGDHNRLGHALMRCYLRYPGRALRVGERPPAALLEFIAEQISVFPESVDEYLANERNRERHAIECREQPGLRYYGKHAAGELKATLLPRAMEDDRLAHLAALATEACRQHRIISPSPLALERLCAELRYEARREVYRRLTHGLSADQRKRLDALTDRRDETNQVSLAWLRQMPEAGRPTKPPKPRESCARYLWAGLSAVYIPRRDLPESRENRVTMSRHGFTSDSRRVAGLAAIWRPGVAKRERLPHQPFDVRSRRSAEGSR